MLLRSGGPSRLSWRTPYAAPQPIPYPQCIAFVSSGMRSGETSFWKTPSPAARPRRIAARGVERRLMASPGTRARGWLKTRSPLTAQKLHHTVPRAWLTGCDGESRAPARTRPLRGRGADRPGPRPEPSPEAALADRLRVSARALRRRGLPARRGDERREAVPVPRPADRPRALAPAAQRDPGPLPRRGVRPQPGAGHPRHARARHGEHAAALLPADRSQARRGGGALVHGAARHRQDHA